MIGAPHFYYVCASGRFFDSRYSVFGHAHIGAEDRFDDNAFGGVGKYYFYVFVLGAIRGIQRTPIRERESASNRACSHPP